MELKKTKKSMAVVTAAILMMTAAFTVMLNVRDISAAENNKKPGDEVKASEEEAYSSNVWWKASLSDYGGSLSLVSYEKIENQTAKNISEAKKKKTGKNILINDTGICYIERHPANYQPIQIIPTYDDEYSGNYGTYSGNDYTTLKPPRRPESEAVSVSPGNFAFTTYGYGHGVGMSQNGANCYAAYSGWGYQQILDHYYPGTYIQKDEITPETKVIAGGVKGSVSDIVSMVTFNEVGGAMAREAIKAQAVAVYTYIMYKGGNAPDLCPKQSPPQNVIDAVNSVLGEALMYDGNYALAMFCASSGGNTASCKDIFYQEIPYLRTVPCEYDSQYDQHYGCVDVFSAEEVRADLEMNLGIELSDDPENWITVIEGDGGYAAYVDIDGQVTIKGNDFRSYIGLKSPKFKVEYH